MTQVTGHNGVRMSVRTAGDPANPGIVLIHGWSQSSLSWTKQLNSALADDYFLIAPDLRGHGASDKPADMRPDRHLPRRSENPGDQLEHEPDAEEDEGGDLKEDRNPPEREQGQHLRLRESHEVRP